VEEPFVRDTHFKMKLLFNITELVIFARIMEKVLHRTSSQSIF
jgi:hypothetical protein